MRILPGVAALALAVSSAAHAQPPSPPPSAGTLMERLREDDSYFPIGVWVQPSALAERYREIGVNLYIGVNRDPGPNDMATLERLGIPFIAEMARPLPEGGTVSKPAGWVYPDEPDNAQRQPDGKWGPCVPAQRLLDDYRARKAGDPSPVFLNFGRGVAEPRWVGRGPCTGNEEAYYPVAAQGADIVGFDVYPVLGGTNRLELVAQGTRRLVRWSAMSDPRRPVWTFIEATAKAGQAPPTPEQLRAQVFMAILNGSRGILYFTYRIEANGRATRPDEIFAHPALADAVRRVNAEIKALAPVFKRGTPLTGYRIESDPGIAVSSLAMRHDDAVWLFVASESPDPSRISVTTPWRAGDIVQDGADGTRTKRLAVTRDGRFTDQLEGYGVRIYRLR